MDAGLVLELWLYWEAAMRAGLLGSPGLLGPEISRLITMTGDTAAIVWLQRHFPAQPSLDPSTEAVNEISQYFEKNVLGGYASYKKNGLNTVFLQ